MSRQALLSQFARSKSGNFAIIGALVAVPLLLAVGVGIDYSLAVNTRNTMQHSLDAAAFAALSLPETASDADRARALQQFYTANGGVGAAVMDSNLLSRTTGASMNVQATYTMPTMFMGLAGTGNMSLGVRSAVAKPIKLKAASFKLDGVTGAWDKTVTMLGRTSTVGPYQPLLRMVYTATNIGGWGTTILSAPNVRNPRRWVNFQRIDCTALRTCRTTALSGDGSAAIDMSAMEEVYLQMDISAQVGAVYWWFKDKVVTLKSNDPNTSDQMFVEGEQMETGKTVNMVEAIGCTDRWVEHRWEDGGGYSGTTAWEGTDFRYFVKGGCTTTGGQVRLTK